MHNKERILFRRTRERERNKERVKLDGGGDVWPEGDTKIYTVIETGRDRFYTLADSDPLIDRFAGQDRA